MTKSILELIGTNETTICYGHFHLMLKLEKSLLCKWKILHPTIESMFRAPCDQILKLSFKKAINDCNGNKRCVSTLVNLWKFFYWASYIIDNIKAKFGLRSSARSESNHSSVKIFVS